MTTIDATTALRQQLGHQPPDRLRPGGLAALTTSERAGGIIASLNTAFPDGELTVHWSAASDDRLVIGGRFEGTHLGPWRGVPATGHRVSVLAIISLAVTNGAVSDINAVADSLSIAEQLGLVAPFEAPACRRPVSSDTATEASAC